MLIHHAIAIFSYTDFLSHEFGHNFALAIIMFEGTTPCSNNRWFLSTMKKTLLQQEVVQRGGHDEKENGKNGFTTSSTSAAATTVPILLAQNSSLYMVNGILFTGGWFILRICLGGYVAFWIYFMREEIFYSKNISFTSTYFSIVLSYIGGYALQWIWFVKIIKGAMKLFLPPKTTDATGEPEDKVKQSIDSNVTQAVRSKKLL